jgi:hypothetical protein
MSVRDVSAKEYRCDNPSCGVPRLSGNGVPVGWSQVDVGGNLLVFHTSDCLRQFLRSVSVEVRDSGGGWIIRGLPGMRR